MPNTVLLSVIIPTHKRAAILRQCLQHLEQQTVRDQIEVIVVSDGHDDETAALFPRMENGEWRMENQWKIPVKFFEIEKSQQGMARNRGVQEATGEWVMFIGDDAFLAIDACERHLAAHQQRNLGLGIRTGKTIHSPNSKFPIPNSSIAVLGHITWDPQVGITPVMQWLERNGWQFGYPLLEPYKHQFIPKELQHRFTYTIFISLPLTVARAHAFQRTELYGWEDIEWGQRLAEMNVRLYYEPDAKAWHHHKLTLEDSLKRMETLGKSAVLMARRDPTFDRLPRGLKKNAYQILALLPTMRGKHAKAFLRGMGAR